MKTINASQVTQRASLPTAVARTLAGAPQDRNLNCRVENTTAAPSRSIRNHAIYELGRVASADRPLSATVEPQTPPDARGLNEVEASVYLGVSRSSLRQGRMDGERQNRMPSPPFVKAGRRVIYLRDDLDAWLERHRHQASSGCARSQ